MDRLNNLGVPFLVLGVRQAYDRPTTWLRTIYTSTTFSPYDIQKSRAIPLPRTGDSNKQNGRWPTSFGRSHRFPNLQEKKEEKKDERSLGKGMAEMENRKRGFHAVVRRAETGGWGELPKLLAARHWNISGEVNVFPPSVTHQPRRTIYLVLFILNI